MKSLDLYRAYKQQRSGHNFLEWADITYPELRLKDCFYNRFIQHWLDGVSDIFSNHTFILWLCKNYYIVDVDND